MSKVVDGAGGPSRKRWAYRVYTIGGMSAKTDARVLGLATDSTKETKGTVEEAINELSNDGWELMPPVLDLRGDLLLFFRR